MASVNDATSSLPHDPLWPRASTWLGSVVDEIPRGGVDLAVIGVPTWRTSISPSGAAQTPAAVRAALSRYSLSGHGRDLDALRIADLGDIDEPDGESGEARVRAAIEGARTRGSLVVALGGDNSATYAVAQGSFGTSVVTAGLVTLDAHHDVRDGISNGSPVRRLIESGLNGVHVAQVGISDFANSPDYSQRVRDYGITVISRADVGRRGVEVALREALDIAARAGGPVHVDIDVDVCDRSVAPGCPASAPGGLSADELRRAAYAIGCDPRVVSVDITEVDATADAADGRTVRLAALCVLELAAGLSTRLHPV